MERYAERALSWQPWLAVLLAAALGWTVWWLASDRAEMVVNTVVVLGAGELAALGLWFVGFTRSIRLTDAQLQVGRFVVALTELEPGSVSRVGEHARGVLVGGQYPPTSGRAMVSVARRNGVRLLVASRRPDAFRVVLADALAATEP